MPTLAERIQRAIDESHLDQSKVARHFGISASAVNQWTKPKKTKPATERLIELAILTGVRTEWLIKGTGPMKDDPQSEPLIFITGEIRSGRRQNFNEHDPIEKAEELPMGYLGGMTPGSLEATRVKGDELEPAYSDGDVLYHPKELDQDWRRHIGRRCLVRLRTGETVAGKVLAGAGRSAQIIDFRGHPIASGAIAGVWRIVWAKQGDG